MLCEKYLDLSIPEKTVAIGEIIHAFQNDNECFSEIQQIINKAKDKGLFNGVQINPIDRTD